MKIKYFYLLGATVASLQLQAYDPPTMGWSSWNTYRVNISDKLIKSQADAMASKGLKDVGYKYINIDDGYFGGRDTNGKLITHPTRFPEGLKGVVEHIHSLGFKAGIYSDAGRNTCGSFWDKDEKGVGVGMYEHDQQDADFFFKEMGFDFIKVDFCGGDASQNAEHLSLSEKERYTAIYQAIQKTGKKDVRLNICRWAFPGTWAHDVSSSWRISQDINASWGAVKNIIGQNLYLSAFATEGKFNDMDMLEIGRGLSIEEEKTHFGMWCIMSSPLLIGCNMTTIPEKSLALLKNKELIALNQDSLALQARVVTKTSDVYILMKDVEQLNGNAVAVAFYNPTDADKSVSINVKDLTLSGKITTRDLFEQKDLGTLSEPVFSVNVPAHGTRIYRMECETRLERTVYEAECAWLSAYQELTNNQSAVSGIFTEASNCSGGAKAGWLGNKASNDLEWRDVYSKEGGKYSMTLSFSCEENRKIYYSINNSKPQEITVNSGSPDVIGTQTVNIVLKKGKNKIRLFNPNAWMPNIDCVKLKRK